MTTCVLGGAGFLGRSLVRQLADSGRSVRVVGRSPTPSATLDARAHYAACDGRDSARLQSLVAGCSEVVDLSYASVARATFSDPLQDLLDNVPVAVNAMRAALAVDVQRYVYISSGGTVYGEQQLLPIREDAVPCPVSPYGIAKLTAERYALLLRHHEGLPVLVLRPGNAYGPAQQAFKGQGFIATAMASVIEGRPVTVFGDRGTVRDYVHVEDVASAVLAALDRGTIGAIYNVGTGAGMDNADLLELIAACAKADGRTVQITHAPTRLADVRANVLDSSALQEATGWRPRIAIADGIAEVWRAQLAAHSS